MEARSPLRLALPTLAPSPAVRRRAFAGLLLVLALLALYFLWLRDSSLVAVEEVDVVGAEGDPAAEMALAQAGAEMTTLHVDEGALWAAVADDPAVVRIDAQPDFPHGLTVAVELREPAAWVAADGGTVLAGDGVVLARNSERPEGLPAINAEVARLGARPSGPVRALARILGAAPPSLARRVEAATDERRHGPVVSLAPGIELRFGDASDAREKWAAAAAVLASPGFPGAAYLDLSVPERPVAGG